MLKYKHAVGKVTSVLDYSLWQCLFKQMFVDQVGNYLAEKNRTCQVKLEMLLCCEANSSCIEYMPLNPDNDQSEQYNLLQNLHHIYLKTASFTTAQFHRMLSLYISFLLSPVCILSDVV